jgi:hypothetical protein
VGGTARMCHWMMLTWCCVQQAGMVRMANRSGGGIRGPGKQQQAAAAAGRQAAGKQG